MEFVSSKTRDLSGQTFNSLTALRPLVSVRRGTIYQTYWMCICSCGNETVVLANRLVAGSTKSCGCALKSRRNNFKHGMRRSSEYNIWSLMRRRCFDPRSPQFMDYGGRGITVCDRWADPKNRGFDNFYEDMGPRPSSGHSLDRENNDGPYSKENCRWATRTQQARNRRNNFIVTAFGKSAPLGEFIGADASEYSRVKERIKSGWDHEKAILTPRRGSSCQP